MVNPSLCVSCGICAGACPTSMPFRRATRAGARHRSAEPVHGHPARPGERCGGGPDASAADHGVRLRSRRRGRARRAGRRSRRVSLACIGQLPPAFIDYVLSRDLADGVLLTGCADGVCFNRFGIAWTEARLAGERDPHLRARVPRERLSTRWLGRHRVAELEQALEEFAASSRGAGDAEDRAAVAGASPGGTARGRPWLSRLRYVGQGAVYLLLALGIGYFSDRPAYTHFPPDMALIKLSFAHGAQKEECRRADAEELAKLPPNMRRPMRLLARTPAGHGRAAARRRAVVSGGAAADRARRRRAVARLSALRRAGRPPRAGRAPARQRPRGGFDYERTAMVELAPAQSLAIDFRAEMGGFVLR